MSWCRWSSMEFSCDLYVFESNAGVEVHVAGRRYVIDRSSLPPGGQFGSAAWRERHQALGDRLRACQDDDDFEPIELPHAGESRVFATPVEAADWIDELEDLGYVVPPGMTDEWREEARRG